MPDKEGARRQHRSVCFFLNTGRTFTFHNVDIVQDNETVVVIHYTGMSDGQEKQATFYKSGFVGIATQ